MFKIKINSRGFTLIELIVTITIIGILSAIVMFSMTQYIAKSKDVNIRGNLAVLVSAGEVWYNVGQTYEDFCGSSAVTNAISQMPEASTGNCYNNSSSGTDNNSNRAGLCCAVNTDGDAWAACAPEFFNTGYAYCVDSRGVKKEIDNSDCRTTLTECSD